MTTANSIDARKNHFRDKEIFAQIAVSAAVGFFFGAQFWFGYPANDFFGFVCWAAVFGVLMILFRLPFLAKLKHYNYFKDILLGLLIALSMWVAGTFSISYLFVVFTGDGGYGVPGLIISPFIIAIISGVWLLKKPKRKFILIGMLWTALIPIIAAGSCTLVSLAPKQ
jgi:hypothetical protein